ncbi:MAG: DsbA family protein [Anaerolineae bacterium]|jgi:protein-disulfide isomerase|nr:DsbA family protein [Anaerolineae bacterium]
MINGKTFLVMLIAAIVVVLVLATIQLNNQSAIVTPPATNAVTLQSGYLERYEGIPTSRTADGAFVLGEATAPVTIVEFADFMCPHCQTYQTIAHDFIDRYVKTGRAKFEYRLYPVVSPDLSVYSAKLAQCADEQREGMFWPAHDLLYDLALNRELNRNTTVQVMAETLDLDATVLNDCIPTANQHETDLALGKSMGVTGTPAVLIRASDGTLGWMRVEGRVLGRGGLPFDALQLVMDTPDPRELIVIPRPLLASLITPDPICALPCWNDITPGVTSWTDANILVGAERNFVNVETINSPNDPTAQLLRWRSIDGLDCCEMFSQDGQTVAGLNIIAITDITAAELIEAQGDPEGVYVNVRGANEALVYLFYPSKQLIVYVFVDGAFSAENSVIGINLLSPDLMQETLTSVNLASWEGYDAWDVYLAAAQATPEAIATEEATPEATPETIVTEEVTPETAP